MAWKRPIGPASTLAAPGSLTLDYVAWWTQDIHLPVSLRVFAHVLVWVFFSLAVVV